ncbi:MAG: Lipopolysaccharide heptosyltransferase [Pedosphaera sp.]|nr:Lipopolysaccharide heptosyltransferase [Pedosphaera sp.]
MVQSLPVLRLLKLHLPQSEIFWWLESSLVPLLAEDPDLAGIYPFHRKRWGAPYNWPEIWTSVRKIRAQRFDWAIDLQGLARSGLFTWWANADLSIGLDGKREGARGFYDVLAPALTGGNHAVDRYLSVLPTLGVPVHQQFKWLPERPILAAQVREKWKTDFARWVVLLPGARWDNKRWPLENFTDLTRRILSVSSDVNIAILGSKDDQVLGNVIAAVNPHRCLDLTGETSLPEMVEWLRLCELVITNDTGPMHVAAALQRPTVAIFGPTNPGATGPHGQRQNVLQVSNLPCVPCLKGHCSYKEPLACLHGITPTMVFEKARNVLKGSVLAQARQYPNSALIGN